MSAKNHTPLSENQKDLPETRAQFIAGAEAFRLMMLEATSCLAYPQIEGVFAAFATVHDFVPKSGVVEQVLTEKNNKVNQMRQQQ